MPRIRLALAATTLAAGALLLSTQNEAPRRDEVVTSQEFSRPVRMFTDSSTTTTQPPPTTTAPPKPSTTTTAPSTQIQRSAPSGGSGDPNDTASWDRLAQCESGGNWSINTGNGYSGGIQFSLSSWRAVGGTGYPHEHSREEQIHRGRLLWEQGGWSHWPGCSRSFGWI